MQKQIAEKPASCRSLVQAGARGTRTSSAQGERLTVGERIALALADKLVFSKVRARFGGRLKYAFSGGAAISREVAEFIDALGIMVYEGYGLTETCPIATANWPGERKSAASAARSPACEIEIDPDADERQDADARHATKARSSSTART